MAQKYGLFNSVGGSPAYNDVDIAGMLSLIVGNSGYVSGFKNELAVTAGAGFQAIIDTGGAWLGDPPGWWYINDEALTLDIDAEVEGYSRIDRVVLRLDRNTEALCIEAKVKKGTPAASDPVAPALTQNSTVFEISLARVLVTGGGMSVEVTDERGSEYCRRILLSGSSTDIDEVDSFMLELRYVGRIIKCNKATTMIVTIPTNANVAFNVGSEVAFYRQGLGNVTFAPEEGVAIRSPIGATKIADQYGACSLRKIGDNEWLLAGNIL